MLPLITRRLVAGILTMLVLSIVVFLVLEINVESVAVKFLGQFSTEDQRQSWLQENGYFDPIYERYWRWFSGFVSGDFGQSTRFRTEVSQILWPRLERTAILAGITMAIMAPLSMLLGVLAGMRESSKLDRGISLFAILTSSVPEFATAVFLGAIFVFVLNWLPGTSPMIGGFQPIEIILPVSVLVIYGIGYLIRMTRASMAEVMGQAYVRTAVLKGLPYRRVIVNHALRNALITPVTVLMLQLPWLLSGVIVVEFFFAYKGFGALLLEASLNDDLFLIEACAMITVFVVVFTQIVADVIYGWLNPRIRF